MPTMLFSAKHFVHFVCVSQNMLFPMQKRPREYAASLEMQNNGSTTAANGDIKLQLLNPRTQYRSNALIQRVKISGRTLLLPVEYHCSK
jgi:hypothetical protein